ncbi:ribonucleotide-diphosphate reductase subunit alpha [Brooklawnia cerclae]|uniref:Ribose/xylose/arabinose/galactoside ABC-type transport system permease subunit n=1 Tax=Brooklawnia cerclae TaxID=349934 RepID=A0ABX0SHT6_9ACTN|nr:ribose/xylose/arabinose/galactoside ABC-type transport system permease subunit [Brooklawnia cerclae]
MNATLAAIVRRREIVIAASIVVISCVVAVISPQFMTVSNIRNVLTSNAVMAVLALGMTIVLVPAHIDVSVGAQLAVTAVVVGDIVTAAQTQSAIVNTGTMLLLGVVIGCVLGALNGLFVALIRLPAIIVTLGTSSILRGVLYSTTNGAWTSGVPAWLTSSQVDGPVGIPGVLIVVAVATVLLAVYMHRTTSGRDVVALGGNREAALRFGVNVSRVDFLVFVIMGAFSGLAGVLYLVQMGSAQPGAGVGFEMTAIAAAILGGASVFGGRIHIGGTLLGVLLLGVIQNGLVLSGVPVYWQDLVSGLIVVAAVTAAVIQDRALLMARLNSSATTKEER